MTREDLRRVLKSFLATGVPGYAAPFQHQGSGTINALVLAMLGLIAQRRNGRVIFAMEEPEQSLPPHVISGSSTYERLARELAVFMAGRAAERLILGDVGAGAGMARESDLGRATALALLIETQCGLGNSGEAYLGEIKDLVYAPSLHLAVNLQLKDAEAKALLTLDRKRGRLEALANALNEEGYLSGDEIREIVCVTPIDLNEAEEEFA